jgi:hypothetical protein
MKAYYEELQKASDKLPIINANLKTSKYWVDKEGLAIGTQEALSIAIQTMEEQVKFIEKLLTVNIERRTR